MNYTLEDKMTSLRAVSIAVILYIFGYFLKVSVLLNSALEIRISNELIRISAASFTGIVFSSALFLISFHKDKNKTPYIVAVSDSVILLLVFDVFNAKSFSELFTLVFISVFMAFIGFNLISSFVDKHNRSKALIEQTLTQKSKSIAGKEKELAILNQSIAIEKQNIDILKQDIAERTCPHAECDEVFKNKKGRDAHKSKCKHISVKL